MPARAGRPCLPNTHGVVTATSLSAPEPVAGRYQPHEAPASLATPELPQLLHPSISLHGARATPRPGPPGASAAQRGAAGGRGWAGRAPGPARARGARPPAALRGSMDWVTSVFDARAESVRPLHGVTGRPYVYGCPPFYVKPREHGLEWHTVALQGREQR